MTRFALLVLAGAGACAAPVRNTAPLGMTRRTITHAGLQRSYLLHAPRAIGDTRGRPLLVVLHGGRSTAEQAARGFRFRRLALREKFVTVYPQAVENNWNDGRGHLEYRSHREQIDDVGFILAIVDEVVAGYHLDARQVYVTGASNGGMMTYRLALKHPERFAAACAMIANLPEKMLQAHPPDEKPQRAIPMMIINGDSDPLMPWEGGDVHFYRKQLGRVISAEETALYWARRNGCRLKPKVEMLLDLDPNDGTRVVRTTYPHPAHADVILYRVKGSGHTIAGATQYLPVSVIGRVSRDMDASEVAWKFFASHARAQHERTP